jgi:glucose 1-dehydrogenase (FAD, quinone)
VSGFIIDFNIILISYFSSGGAVNSPQLLLLSGVGPSEELKKVGVNPIHELPGVGRNLHNHVAFALNFALNDTNSYPLNWATAMEYLLFRDGLMSGTGLSQVTAFVNSKYADTSIDHPDIQFFFGGFLAQCSKTGQIGEMMDESPRIINMIPTAVHPKSRGYLTLASNDPLAHPKIFANYLTHPDDIKVVVEGIKFAIRLANTKALQKYGIKLDTTPVKGCEKLQFGCDDYWECAVKQETAPENHQVGSCKMGADGDPNAVLNTHLQVDSSFEV